MDKSDLRRKLSILEKKTSDLLATSSVNVEVEKYLQNTKAVIERSQKEITVLTRDEDGYSFEFAKIAYEVLASSPFTTKAHLCVAFRVTEIDIDKWTTLHEPFKKCIEQGILEGEIMTRNLLVQAAFEPSAKINTGLLKILANNVYNIKDSHDINLKAPDNLEFKIEVVSANKNTGS